jgi:hypothetical protein
MALDSGYWSSGNDMTTDDVAMLLVKLYSDYKSYSGENDDYARAVAIAIRMLAD